MTKHKSGGGAHVKAQGDVGEKFVHELANKYYFPFLCFPNPHVPGGGDEICDMLLVCGSYAIIWQVKHIKKRTSGDFKKREVEKAIRQCRGARKTLESLGKVKLAAADGNQYSFDPAKIRSWHQVAVFVGEEPDFIGFYDDAKKYGVHTFTHSFLTTALQYLDTIPDLSEYLAAKEKFLHGNKMGVMLSGSENNLLAAYLQNERTFGTLEKDTKDTDMALLDIDGMWDEFVKSDAYKYKMKADAVSKGWDFLIHAAAEQMNSAENPELSRELVEILSSHNRLERRMLSKAFGDGWQTAQGRPPNQLYRRLSPADINGTKVMYIFQWMGDRSEKSKQMRYALLENTGYVARKEHPDYQVIVGITAERRLQHDSPISFMLQHLDGDNWTPELLEHAKFIQKKLGILTNVQEHRTTSYEFDDDD